MFSEFVNYVLPLKYLGGLQGGQARPARSQYVSPVGEEILDGLETLALDRTMERRAGPGSTRAAELPGIHFHLVGVGAMLKDDGQDLDA